MFSFLLLFFSSGTQIRHLCLTWNLTAWETRISGVSPQISNFTPRDLLYVQSRVREGWRRLKMQQNKRDNPPPKKKPNKQKTNQYFHTSNQQKIRMTVPLARHYSVANSEIVFSDLLKFRQCDLRLWMHPYAELTLF